MPEGIKLGDVFPNFSARTSKGPIQFYDWSGDSWTILFSHPRDFTPVCTTELSRVAQLYKEFAKRNCKLIALSCDSVKDHTDWMEDLKDYSTCEILYPVIGDEERELAKQLGMIDPDETNEIGMPLTCRAVFIVGPDRRLKLSILYPATTGRNFDEILRVVDSLQLTMNKKVATPADWKPGGECMVLPTVSQEDVPRLFPKGVTVRQMPSGRNYMRFTPQPD